MLVEDDNKDIREKVYAHLTREGYKVTKAYDGEEVVQQLTDANSFDLILLDLMLETEWNGFTAVNPW